jgi:hypothetical protein
MIITQEVQVNEIDRVINVIHMIQQKLELCEYISGISLLIMSYQFQYFLSNGSVISVCLLRTPFLVMLINHRTQQCFWCPFLLCTYTTCFGP